MANRQLIIHAARKHLGAHYLWGSGGARPGVSDGAWYRAGDVDLQSPSLNPSSPAVFAAVCSKDGVHVCAGRYLGIQGGRQTSRDAVDLKSYLDSLSKLPQTMWLPYYSYFSPRNVVGHTIDDAPKIVWGEDCRGTRHFDCISFINYVLTESTQPFWSADIKQMHLPQSGTVSVDMNATPVDGDILFRGNQHIAFLCANGRVIQAEDHSHGVHENEKYHAVHWSERRRVADSFCWD